jgi:hypothetical protein
MNAAYSVLYDFLDGYRECAGNYDLEERKSFVERFVEWKSVGGVTMYHPKLGWGPLLREWAEEILELGIDTKSMVGKRIMAGLLDGIGGGEDEHLMKLILIIADDVADDTEELKVNGNEPEWAADFK